MTRPGNPGKRTRRPVRSGKPASLVEQVRQSTPARPRDVLDMLRAKGLLLAVGESCTGGLLAAALTNVPGASAVFQGGVVAYADDAKERLLGVDPLTLRSEGAVSQATATAMARGACQRFGADVGIAVTGIAGPGGAVPGKPVGTVWFAVADGLRGAVHAEVRRFPGARAQVRQAAVAHALRMVLDYVAKMR